MVPEIHRFEQGVPIFFEKDRDTANSQSSHNNLKLDEEIINILPLKETVMFPEVIMPLVVTREASMQLIDDTVVKDKKIISMHALKDSSIKKPTANDIYNIGVISVIHSMLRLPDQQRLIVQGIKRVKIIEIISEQPYITAKIAEVPDIVDWDSSEETQMEALKRNVAAAWQKLITLSQNMPDELQAISHNISDPSLLADTISLHFSMDPETKQDLLETVGIKRRLKKVLSLLSREIEVLELGAKIQNEVSGELSKSQKEYFLREQIKAIRRELGEKEDGSDEIEELTIKIEEAEMPQEAYKQATREVERLARINPSSPEYTLSRTYIDWLVTLPWSIYSKESLDIKAVAKSLDKDHYGLEKIKDRILEYLSVRKFKNDENGRHPILCLSGPPGVGKTSLGKSIAKAIGRKFIRISLGGVRDEAEIRGHRRTYIGALPGQIIQGMKRAETHNPVFMLDEIDKVASDYRGDPASALLEVLDPEQNSTFRDHYLEVPFDLSKVFFITTANRLDTISPPLRDRMEILEIAGYTEEEKIEIAKRHLIPKQLEEHGLSKNNISFAKDGIIEIIRGYTREAGVRTLERQMASVCRKCAREWAEGRDTVVKINKAQVHKYLGSPRFMVEELDRRVSDAGVMVGMAWTATGGDILYIEASKMPGKGHLQITGQLGDVMKESAQIAYSYVKAHAEELGIAPDFYESIDIHLHVPAGAIPKDGPSAGVTLISAIVSLLTGRKAVNKLAMTGEITLRGKVLPIGGLKEKLLAARRSGINQVIVPISNKKDVLEDVPESVLSDLKINYVESIQEVLELALEK